MIFLTLSMLKRLVQLDAYGNVIIKNRNCYLNAGSIREWFVLLEFYKLKEKLYVEKSCIKPSFNFYLI